MPASFPPWNDEHELFRKTVREFTRAELTPHRHDWDKAEAWPARALLRKMGELGFLGIRMPTEYGGAGLDWWYTIAFVEELCHARNGGVIMSTLVHTDMTMPVLEAVGTEEQKQEFLIPAIRGERIGALGITEPGCGSDVASIVTTARVDGDDYIINGAKTYITNGSFADYIVLGVRTGEAGYAGISLVLFPTSTPGFSVGRKLDKLGTRSVDSCELHFDNCRVPRRYLLGEENAGFYYIMRNFQGERLVGALMGVCGAEVALADTITYTQQREVFGKPVVKFQVWRHRFAEMMTQIQAAKMLAYHAADIMNSGEDATLAISQAKLLAGDLCNKVAYDCLQAYGGYGYIEEYDIARYFRDARLLPIGGGTSEVMKEIIAKWSGL